jgi:hypothetical protein
MFFLACLKCASRHGKTCLLGLAWVAFLACLEWQCPACTAWYALPGLGWPDLLGLLGMDCPACPD